MAVLGTGHASHNTLFDPAKRQPGQLSKEQEQAIIRLKIRRARGVVEDDPIGFDSATDPRYSSFPTYG